MHQIVTRTVSLFLTMGLLLMIGSCSEATDDARVDEPKISATETPSLLKVNSLKQFDDLKKKLNNQDSIGMIDHDSHVKSHYVQNEVTVKFKVYPTEEEMADIERDIEGKLIKQLHTICVFSSDHRTAKELVRFFEKSDNVIYAEPHYLYMQNEDPPVTVPNDVLYPDHQWNLPMIEAESGWNRTKGNDDVTIAVLDTGVDLDHPDLALRLTDGYHALSEGDRPQDDNGHGTHVAGIIASHTNNREGIAGITWFGQIMPIKVMGAEGSGASFDIAKGIMWAADRGADVINLSLGNYEPSAVLEEAIQYAYSKNAVIIAAAGNDNTDQPSYPAAYPEVLGISAVDSAGERAEFSNYGDYVDVTAPGVEIASTYPGRQYAELSGTSMAAPHVAALAALVRSLHPDLTNEAVTDIIKRTAVDLGEPGVDIFYGNGLIDINSALEAAYKEKYPFGKVSQWLEHWTSP